MPFPAFQCWHDWLDMNAVDRAGWNAQVASGAFAFYNSVHVFCGTEYGVNRTGLNAQGTTNAGVFVDVYDRF